MATAIFAKFSVVFNSPMTEIAEIDLATGALRTDYPYLYQDAINAPSFDEKCNKLREAGFVAVKDNFSRFEIADIVEEAQNQSTEWKEIFNQSLDLI